MIFSQCRNPQSAADLISADFGSAAGADCFSQPIFHLPFVFWPIQFAAANEALLLWMGAKPVECRILRGGDIGADELDQCNLREPPVLFRRLRRALIQ